jgi:hypothetical protein
MTWTGLLAATACGCTVGSRVRGDRHLVPRLAHDLAIVGHHKATARVSREMVWAKLQLARWRHVFVGLPTRPSGNFYRDTPGGRVSGTSERPVLTVKEH